MGEVYNPRGLTGGKNFVWSSVAALTAFSLAVAEANQYSSRPSAIIAPSSREAWQ